MSAERPPQRGGFDVLDGGRRASAVCAGTRVVVAGDDDPPFPVDAAVFEEDTWLALSAPVGTLASPGHPVRVITQAWDAQPLEPGTVVVKAGRPTRLLAVVHDLDRDPSWTSAWVRQALTEALRIADEQGSDSLRLPILGAHHGSLPALEFARLLRAALESMAPSASRRRKRIWLVHGDVDPTELLQELTESGDAGP